MATGARPRVVAGAEPDGERILTWTQVYALDELPERLIVVGSGVTGAEFASAYGALGSDVVLVSSRDRVLPGEDADAAQVLEDVFRRRGMTVLNRSRASTVARTADGVRVTLTDGRTVDGSHCLMAVGSIPNTEDLGLAEAGVVHGRRRIRRRRPGVAYVAPRRVRRRRLHRRPHAGVGRCHAGPDRDVARTRRRGRAAGPARRCPPTCSPTPRSRPSASPRPTSTKVAPRRSSSSCPLAGNARAKMQGMEDGFVKLFASTGSAHRHRRRRRRAAGQRARSSPSPSPSRSGSPSTRSSRRSPSIRRSPAPSPRPPAGSTPPSRRGTGRSASRVRNDGNVEPRATDSKSCSSSGQS